jgi:hypothetical protein
MELFKHLFDFGRISRHPIVLTALLWKGNDLFWEHNE